ncbi:hypothetical protein VTI74DRAFT_426 [Chaetomium olivicolor]
MLTKVIGSRGHNKDGRVNPMKMAIQSGRNASITVMVCSSTEPTGPWFRYYYLKEAYMMPKPAMLACLLAHPSMRFGEADVTDEADMPLAHLAGIDPALRNKAVQDPSCLSVEICWKSRNGEKLDPQACYEALKSLNI